MFIFILHFGKYFLVASEKLPFTAADSLRIKFFSPHSMTDDGRYIAGLVGMWLDSLGIDHKRFGDPTYISPRLADAVILDTETKKLIPLLKSKNQVQTMTWSPDGKTLAFFLRKGDRFFLQTYDRLKKTVRGITLKTDQPIASNSFLIWTNDGSRILLTLRASDWEKKSKAMFKEATNGPITIYDSREPFLKWEVIRSQSALIVPAIADVKTGKVRELLPEGRYGRVRIAKDDSLITYIVTRPIKTIYGRNRQSGRESELFLLDLKAGAEAKTLVKFGGKRLNFSWNEENNLFAWAEEGDIFIQSVKETEARNLTKDQIVPEKGREKDKKDEKSENLKPVEKTNKKKKKIRFSLNRFSPDATKLLLQTSQGYWLIDRKSGHLEMVYEFPKKQKDGEPIRGGRSARVVAWSPDGRYLYMTHSVKDKWERGFTRYDLQERKMEDLVKDSNLYRGLQMAKDGQKFFYSFSNGDLPSDYFMTDRDFREQVRLTTLNSWVMDRKLTWSELIRYLDVDGSELYGILYYPVDYIPGKKYPLVCEIYAMFFDNGFNSNMNIIANQGWFGLRPSVNLKIGYPEAWIKGVTSVINKLIEKGLVDPKKLGVHGTSFGGFATSMLITQTDRFSAAINISGKVNSISFLGDSPRIGTRNYYSAEAGWFSPIGATLWEQPLKYINHSAVMYADRIKTPHLLITGGGDWNVPPGNTREMYYAMRRLGKECVWVNYYNDGHGIGAAEDESIYKDKWNRIIDWYKTHFAEADKNNIE